MMCNLQSALLLLVLLCTVQLFVVFHLVQIGNRPAQEIELRSLLKAVQSQNRLLHKRFPPIVKRRVTQPVALKLNDNVTKYDEEWKKNACEVIDVAIVCAGFTSVRTVQPLIKSLLFFRRRNPIHLHLMVDQMSHLIFHRLLTTWNIPSLTFSFYQTDELKALVDWIPNLHYSGIYGLVKLVLVEALPLHLHKVIVLDTDITCNSDISELWAFFDKFKSQQVVGLIDNQSNWYLRPKHWPALGRGFNTGVVLMHLDRLRAMNWTLLWKNVTLTMLKIRTKTDLADQDIFNAVLKLNPHLVYTLPCEWNVQLNENALSEWCYLREDSVLKMIHWNSPSKDRVRNRDSETFRKTYLAFAEYDGGLLKREIFGCRAKQRTRPKAFDSNRSGRGLCSEVRRAGSTVYRTHLYFLDFEDSPVNTSDVTLVTQFSIDRILMLETIANQWPGPISAAVYVSDAEALSLLNYVSSSPVLSRRKNIGYHVVYKQGTNWQDLYPINYLRNVAMDQVRTDFQLLSDVDFVPKLKLRDYLIRFVKNLSINSTVETKLALVLPAFETSLHKFFLPIYKKLLLALWDKNLVTPFRFGMWKAGQFAVNYTRWRNAVEPYEVEWTPYFEPFVMVSKFAPQFDTRFVGFGWNKVSYTMALHSQGYRFFVLPEAFLVHFPHSPSLSNNKYRLDYRYRSCMHQLKKEFLKDVKLLYNNSQMELEF